jgi:hypothetical protein
VLIEFGIVVIAYNRVSCLERLLKSLVNSEYLGDSVELIISIDFSGETKVSEAARRFNWPHGKKVVIEHSAKLGLRNHVLYCGNLTEKYRNVCVFEDDLFVSPGFYNFSKQAIAFYEHDERVAGISLYTHFWNYIADRPFLPICQDADVFVMQQAQSWGQIWTQSKWTRFYKWYLDNQEMELAADHFPISISSWPNSSWLKYFMRYIVDTNKYFIYPSQSLSTNFTAVGTHAKESSSTYQVPLEVSVCKKYRFVDLDETKNKYDVFFENENVPSFLNLEKGSIAIDLYGAKSTYPRYVISPKRMNFKVIKSFGLDLRPHELNVIFDNPGSFFCLYDTDVPSDKISDGNNKVNQFCYDSRLSSRAYILAFLFSSGLRKIKLNIKTLLK